MLEKLYLVLKLIQMLRWNRDNAMLFRPSDQQEKDLLEKMETAHII